MTIDFKALAAPFPASAIHWRAQTLTKDGDKALALSYLDARDVMDRLDDVCGPENWKDSYVETTKGRTIGTLEIRVGDEWIGKSDGSGDTDIEGEKGSISGALKRAAVKWGIGRYLYDLGNVWAPCESYDYQGKKRWKKWLPSAQAQFDKALFELTGQRDKPVEKQAERPKELPTGPINDKTRDWLKARIEGKGKTLGAFCAEFEVDSLKKISYEQMDAVKAWLEKEEG